VAAAAAAVAAVGLALHHPLSVSLALLGCVALAAANFVWPLCWLLLLPALLPLLGLMPWSGWLTFEEFDIAVLAIAAGGHLRLAWRRPGARGVAGASALKGLVLLAYGAVVALSVWRGFQAGGGFEWGWWQGYHEPMNALRVGKSFFLFLLLLPLWRAALRETPQAAPRRLAAGLAAGLGVVALLGLWERLAFTGLADFSSDYRITAMFWEMHVGGAALDGFLALTMPFAVHQLMQKQAAWRWGLAAAAVLLGAYACLVTFSRGVYLAVPLGLALSLGLQTWRARRARGRLVQAQAAVGAPQGRPALLGWAGFTALAFWIFPGSGYRGLLACLGAVVLLLPMAACWRRLPGRTWAGGIALGAFVALLLGLASLAVAKGAYVAYAVAWGTGAALLIGARWRGRGREPMAALHLGPYMLAAFIALLLTIPLVAGHWGDPAAVWAAIPAALLLLALALWSGRGAAPHWPESWRWQGGLLAAMAASALLVGVLLGGAYMENRFSTGGQDVEGRGEHWRQALSLLRSPADWAFGKGAGRFPADQFLTGLAEDQTGDYRLRSDGSQPYLALYAGKHVQGWGEIFRVSQRVAPITGGAVVHAEVRAKADASLHLEVCEKHLLYNAACRTRNVEVKAQPGVWQPLQLPLLGPALTRGHVFAPRLIVFSMAVESAGHELDVRAVQLVDNRGRELINNGDFRHGMARWFFSSDRHHLPWHMKNMLLHVVYEQGLLGAVLLSLLVVGALWRVVFGHARDHELAPPLAGALLGVLAVGLFDSLLDVPRLAFVFYLLLAVALTLPAFRPSRATP